MTKASKHGVPNPSGGWAVKNSGVTRASRIFGTQAEAVRFGRDAARRGHAELYVHGRDGTIKERNSYGPDPFPMRDKA